MLHIIWSIIVGFIIGLIARAIMPGMQHLGFIITTLLGIGGSILGGLIARLFSKPEPGSSFHPAGLIMSIIGALILLFLWGKFNP
ncbi:MAG: GlsB/YeaQ/YmgE family stress response membrane protein [Verrucomicrobiota bacterium]